MWIGEQEVDLHVVVDGKTIKQVNSFLYLGDTVCEDGGSSKEIQRRVQAGAAATKKKSVGSLHCTSLYIWVGNTGTDRETGGEDADSRKQLQRICKVTQEDRRKMKELREEIGMKKHLKIKVAGSRMRWAGHVQRMGEDRLSKTAWKAEEGGRRRKGRPKL